jgi:predicted ATPase
MPRRSPKLASSAGADTGYLLSITLLRDKVPSFDTYPFSIPAVRSLQTLRFSPRVTFLIGENGSGKSTLIEAIAILAGFNPEGGSKNIRFASHPSESSLHQALRLARGTRREKAGFFLRAETLFNLATEVEARGLSVYGWDDMHAKSHGEAFLWLVKERFRPQGLYILDEPEAALSPQRQLAMLCLMHDLVAEHCQMIIATHSPILMAYPGATIYMLSDERIEAVAYEATEHFQVMRGFLGDHRRYLRQLLSDPPSEHPV